MLNANGFTKVPLFLYCCNRSYHWEVPKKDSNGVEYRHDMFMKGRLDLLPIVSRPPAPKNEKRSDMDNDSPHAHLQSSIIRSFLDGILTSYS